MLRYETSIGNSIRSAFLDKGELGLASLRVVDVYRVGTARNTIGKLTPFDYLVFSEGVETTNPSALSDPDSDRTADEICLFETTFSRT
jgi:hypothetical protein